METTHQEVDSFIQFAKQRLGNGGTDLTIDELFDAWRREHPPSEDVQAIQASIRDMENGDTGRPFDEFANDFRQRNSGLDGA